MMVLQPTSALLRGGISTTSFLVYGADKVVPHLKCVVYAKTIQDVQTLEQHIHDACDAIRMQDCTFEQVQQLLLQRVHTFLEARGVTLNTSSNRGLVTSVVYCIVLPIGTLSETRTLHASAALHVEAMAHLMCVVVSSLIPPRFSASNVEKSPRAGRMGLSPREAQLKAILHGIIFRKSLCKVCHSCRYTGVYGTRHGIFHLALPDFITGLVVGLCLCRGDATVRSALGAYLRSDGSVEEVWLALSVAQVEEAISAYVPQRPSLESLLQIRHDGNTARLARRSDEALGVPVSVARIAPSLLGLGRPTGVECHVLRTPDLNPLHCYRWGHLKAIVYGTPVPHIAVVRQRVELGSQQMRAIPGVFERVRQPMPRLHCVVAQVWAAAAERRTAERTIWARGQEIGTPQSWPAFLKRVIIENRWTSGKPRWTWNTRKLYRTPQSIGDKARSLLIAYPTFTSVVLPSCKNILSINLPSDLTSDTISAYSQYDACGCSTDIDSLSKQSIDVFGTSMLLWRARRRDAASAPLEQRRARATSASGRTLVSASPLLLPCQSPREMSCSFARSFIDGEGRAGRQGSATPERGIDKGTSLRSGVDTLRLTGVPLQPSFQRGRRWLSLHDWDAHVANDSVSIAYIQNPIARLRSQRIKEYGMLSEDCEASRAEEGGGGGRGNFQFVSPRLITSA
ncbi:hypothetical protein PR048_004889 [Dryococelus australis]|uniref:Uncharacterized protein n=1 Tax=Dryococelus australis TaxID=614101 RepID=A0ABQ9I6N7_9NEOP|nr:hypothetical protein PR048_004889 [Dryococelus australis]